MRPAGKVNFESIVNDGVGGESLVELNGTFPKHKCRCVMECIKQMPFFMW